jgi:O-antigen/teichoic acid export membrane protein
MTADTAQPGALLRNTLFVAAGSIAGQLVVLLATPLIARMYGAPALGTYAAFAAIASVLCVVSSLRYEVLIAQGKSDEVPTRVLLALLVTVLVAGIGCLALLAGGASLLDSQLALGNAVWLLPLVVLLGGIAQAGTYLSVRLGNFLPMASFRLVNPALFAAAALLLPSLGLAGAHILGLFTALLFAYVYRSRVGTGVRAAVKVGWRLRQAPLRLMPAALMDACAIALPVVFVGAIYGAAEAGNFSQIQRLVVGPILILSVAAGYSVHSASTRLVRDNGLLMPLVRQAIIGLGSLAAAWLALVVFAGSQVLEWLLGLGWRTERAFIVMILLAYIVRVIVSPLSTILLALGRHRTIFIWQAALFIWVAALIPTIAQAMPFDAFLFAFATVEGLFYLLYFALIISATRSHDKKAGASSASQRSNP